MRPSFLIPTATANAERPGKVPRGAAPARENDASVSSGYTRIIDRVLGERSPRRHDLLWHGQAGMRTPDWTGATTLNQSLLAGDKARKRTDAMATSVSRSPPPRTSEG